MSDKPPLPRRMRDRFDIVSTVPRARIRKAFLMSCAMRAAREIRKPVHSISFVLVGDRKMSSLHREYSRVAGTTDVLTFDLSDTTDTVEGEVVICVDQARRQASDFGVPLFEEVARLAIHGVLHLAGYDDRTEREREQMRQLEERYLKAGRRAL